MNLSSKELHLLSKVSHIASTLSSLITGYLYLKDNNYIYFASIVLLFSLFSLLFLRWSILRKAKTAEDKVIRTLLEIAITQNQPHHDQPEIHKQKIVFRQMKPIHVIELEEYLSALISFAKPLNSLSSNSMRYSQEDLAFLRFWISGDEMIRNWLSNFRKFPESLFCSMLFLLIEKGDLSNGQWCQFCSILFEFMGGVPESPEIRAEMCVGEEE